MYGAALDERTGRWYVVTGNTPDGPVAETSAYDVALRQWSMLRESGDVLPARCSADAAIAGGRLYVFSGHEGKGELDDLWALALTA